MAIRSEENHMSLGRIKFLYEIESCIEVLMYYYLPSFYTVCGYIVKYRFSFRKPQ